MWVGIQSAELFFEHVRSLYTEFHALDVSRLREFVLVGGQLLHPVVPVRQPLDTTVLHAVEQTLTSLAGLETVNRIHIIKEERQIKNLQLGGVAVKLGQRSRQDLDVT